MRISDWSSDVCSSDLGTPPPRVRCGSAGRGCRRRPSGLSHADRLSREYRWPRPDLPARRPYGAAGAPSGRPDRKSVGEGKSVSVRVDLGGRRYLKKKKHKKIHIQYKTAIQMRL